MFSYRKAGQEKKNGGEWPFGSGKIRKVIYFVKKEQVGKFCSIKNMGVFFSGNHQYYNTKRGIIKTYSQYFWENIVIWYNKNVKILI